MQRGAETSAAPGQTSLRRRTIARPDGKDRADLPGKFVGTIRVKPDRKQAEQQFGIGYLPRMLSAT
jgi:hypothetical protein